MKTYIKVICLIIAHPCYNIIFVCSNITASVPVGIWYTGKLLPRPGASFTKQLSKNLGLSSSLSEKFTLIPYYKILSLNLKYCMKLAPGQFY